MDLAYFNVTKFNITKKYKSEQKFFSQWMMKTPSALNIPCTTTHQAPSETRPELSIQELRCMTDDIAAYIQQTRNLPEGLHDALNMVFAHLAGRRECAALFRSQTLKDGQDRSKEDAGHQKAIGDFKDIYSTLRNAVALAASKKTLQTPLAKRSKSLNGIRYTIPDGLLSNRADDTPVPSEQRGTQPMQVATTTGTATLPNYNSNLRRGLDSLASIRRSVRVTWCDYRVRKSDLYDATQLSRHAFALSRGVIAELIAKSTGSKPLLESVMELRERLGKTGTGSDYDDLCCVRASKILALMHESVVLRHSDSEDVSSRRLKLTQRCKDYHPLAYHLCFVIGLLPERAKGQRQGVALYEQTDPLLLTLYQLCNVQEVTLEAIVVVQLYLELYETAGMPNLRHIETLTATAKIMKRSLLALNYADRNFEKQPLSLELTSEPGQAFRRIADEVIVLGEADSKLAKGDASPKSVLRFLLIHFPILCGMVYTSMISNFYLDGIQVSQYDSRVTAAARLYRTTEFVVSSQKWAQLEDFVALQGKDTLGLMGCDGDDYEPVSAAIELSIALGIPRTDFEKLELKNDGLTDRLPLPHITTAGALALPRNRHSLLGAEQETMSQSDRATITSPGQSRCVLQLLVRDKMRQPQMAAAHPEIHNALRRQDRLCPVHLLEILSESLAADSQHLKFNHHDLTLSCWELLRTITSDHGGTLLASRSFFSEDAASGRSNVVDDVMWEVIALGVIAEDDPAHPGTSSSVLYKIAPALDKSFTRDSSKPS